MQHFSTLTVALALQALPLGAPQESPRPPHAVQMLAGTWVLDPARYEEYWNPKDTNGLQRRAPQPGMKIPTLTIVAQGDGLTVNTTVDGVVVSSQTYKVHESYRADEQQESVPLADGVVLHRDSHWTAQGLSNRWATVRGRDTLARGSELWAPSDDGQELTITAVQEGLGSKSKTIAVYRRRGSD